MPVILDQPPLQWMAYSPGMWGDATSSPWTRKLKVFSVGWSSDKKAVSLSSLLVHPTGVKGEALPGRKMWIEKGEQCVLSILILHCLLAFRHNACWHLGKHQGFGEEGIACLGGLFCRCRLFYYPCAFLGCLLGPELSGARSVVLGLSNTMGKELQEDNWLFAIYSETPMRSWETGGPSWILWKLAYYLTVKHIVYAK